MVAVGTLAIPRLGMPVFLHGVFNLGRILC
jgi:hypothetical protein